MALFVSAATPRDPAPARASVAIGFGSPADDTGVTRLDLNDILVKHPQATFLMRVAATPCARPASTRATWC